MERGHPCTVYLYVALYRRTYLVVDGEEDLQRAFGLTLGRGFHSTGCVHPLSETRRGLQDRLHLVLPGDYIRLLFFLFGLRVRLLMHQIVFAVVIQFVWTGVPPSALSTLGMVIIIAAGLWCTVSLERITATALA
jgi:hypothetical protein